MDKALEARYIPAALQALDVFSIEPEDIELIAHSENISFRISARDSDDDLVLRLHRPGYNTIEELDSERKWVRALHAAGVPVPDSLRTGQGQHFALVDIPGTREQRYAGMTTWHDGTILSDFLETSSDGAERQRIFRRIGEIAASIHNQSTSWEEPPGFERRRLDLEGLLGEAPLWGRFWEHGELTESERAVLLQERRNVRAALEAYGESPENFSLIHADLHPDNIVYNKGALALIDFDDSAYGWHMYDVASALIECTLAPDFGLLSSALLEGYVEHRPLAERDLDMLPVFLLIRGMAIIGWFHQRPEHAGSSFFEALKAWVLETCDSTPVRLARL